MTRADGGNAPVPATSLVGRRAARTAVRRALEQTSFVTLTGPGGIGKSRLAIAVAEDVLPKYPDGVWFIDLSELPVDVKIEDYVLDAIAGPDHSQRRSEGRLISYLRSLRALLIFDNCESQLGPAIKLITRILSSGRDIHVLATSREAFDSVRERVIPVQPLGVPDADAMVDPYHVAQFDSVKLLLDRASAVRPGFRVDEDNWRMVASVCSRLEGNPLAIELVASRLRSLTIGEVATSLADRLSIATKDLSVPVRHKSLRSMIDWSWDLCTESERVLWRRCSMFAGGFDLAAAERVCGSEGFADAVWAVIDHLVAKSLIVATSTGASIRFRLLETIAEYGREQLSASGELDTISERHFDYFASVAQTACDDWGSSSQPDVVTAMRTERSNFARALEWSFTAAGAQSRGMRLAANLRIHWAVDGFLRDGSRWMNRALAGSDEPSEVRGDALWVSAWISILQGDATAAEARLAEAWEIAESLADDRLRAYVHLFRGTADLWRGDLDIALERLGAAHAYFAAATRDECPGPHFVSMLYALALAETGHYDEIRELDDGNPSRPEHETERWGTSQLLWAYAYGIWMAGDYETASARLQHALRMNLAFDRVGTALKIDSLAWMSASRRQLQRAARLLGAARAIWSDLGTSIAAFGTKFAERSDDCYAALQAAISPTQLDSFLAEGARLDYESLLAYAVDTKNSAAVTGSNGDILTARERQVADLLADGLSNRRIAERLVLSPRTVEGYVASVLSKLALESRSQVVAWVTRERSRLTAGAPIT